MTCCQYSRACGRKAMRFFITLKQMQGNALTISISKKQSEDDFKSKKETGYDYNKY